MSAASPLSRIWILICFKWSVRLEYGYMSNANLRESWAMLKRDQIEGDTAFELFYALAE
ncbi:hypothetical protein THOG05_40186 [Vibrio rotiferianus]|nr:hypothetical protein THOG05_40186 [Vibrio rotiferianus]